MNMATGEIRDRSLSLSKSSVPLINLEINDPPKSPFTESRPNRGLRRRKDFHLNPLYQRRLFKYFSLLIPAHTRSTISPGFCIAQVDLGNWTFDLHIWDTAGQEAYRAISAQYYRDAAIGLIVFDVTNDASLSSVREWNEHLRSASSEDVIVALIGNKIDLPAREVSREAGEEIAAQIKALYRETSAATGAGVSEVFEDICEEWMRRPANAMTASEPLVLESDRADRSCC
jgi:small GTP-binding protein